MAEVKNSDKDWKQKYSDLLRELEQSERQWRDQDKLYRRALSHLTLVGQGQHDALDEDLGGFRHFVRDEVNADEIKQRIDSLVERAEQFAVEKGRGPVAAVDTVSGDSAVSLESGVAVIRHLSHKLSGGGDPQAGEVLEQKIRRIESLESLQQLAEAVVGSFNQTPSVRLDHGDKDTSAICRDLIRLLDRQPIPSKLQSEAKGLRQQLKQSKDPSSVRPLVRSLVEFCSAVAREIKLEREGLEKFLLKLGTRLAEMEESLHGQQQEGDASLARTVGLNEAFGKEVKEIRSVVSASGDIGNLKTEIHHRLDDLESLIEGHREQESHSRDRSKKEIVRLLKKVEVLESESNQLRIRIAEEKARALHDPLTKVHNRLSLDERLEQEYERWRRYGKPLTLVIWDLDHFKDINDNYGHQAGDKVLVAVAGILQKRLRSTDFTARYGGEEFVSLLPETAIHAAVKVIDDVRRNIETCSFHYRNNKVAVTVSSGVAQFRSGDTVESVMQRADQALYTAKQKGRNRCEQEAA